MHVGTANPRWRGRRSRHSALRIRNPQLYVSGKRSMIAPATIANTTSNMYVQRKKDNYWNNGFHGLWFFIMILKRWLSLYDTVAIRWVFLLTFLIYKSKGTRFASIEYAMSCVHTFYLIANVITINFWYWMDSSTCKNNGRDQKKSRGTSSIKYSIHHLCVAKCFLQGTEIITRILIYHHSYLLGVIMFQYPNLNYVYLNWHQHYYIDD